jgi:tRNA nucleotidyltransferase (CCA-adding enzyme)
MRDGDPLRIDLPPLVAAVLSALREGGEEAVLVGGCVRDLVRGDQPADWDVATAAPPETVAARFPGSTWENAFGTVTVRDPNGGRGVEVTTYRTEAGYRDKRRPDEVRWGRSLADDLARRDFTINAIAWGMRDGAPELRDPFGGLADLRGGVIRAVGRAEERFAEDALRMLRALRFAATLGFEIDRATLDAIRSNARLASELSGERVGAELRRILGALRP